MSLIKKIHLNLTKTKTQVLDYQISFSYKDNLILDNISYKFDSGKIYGIKEFLVQVKPLINLILGLLSQKMENYLFIGKIYENINFPNDLFSYVPHLLDTSISQNIAIGVDEKDINYEYINHIVDLLDLKEFIKIFLMV